MGLAPSILGQQALLLLRLLRQRQCLGQRFRRGIATVSAAITTTTTAAAAAAALGCSQFLELCARGAQLGRGVALGDGAECQLRVLHCLGNSRHAGHKRPTQRRHLLLVRRAVGVHQLRLQRVEVRHEAAGELQLWDRHARAVAVAE